MNCELCDKTDGLCYTSQPPQVKCTVTGEFHFFSDKCNVIELFRKVKAERDAAVRDIVEAMEADLSMCELTHQCWFCAFYNSDDCPLEKDGECAPKWRGPQQEPHWIDNADSYVCSYCGYECNNPNLLKDGPSVCPNCKRQMKATYGPQQEET